MSIAKQKNFDCAAATEHLHEYIDSELKPDLRTAMEQHLASCADCAATLAQLRQIETAHQRLDARLESPPDEYWQALPQRVMEKVKASEKRRLLALPKLPRLKSPVKRAPVGETAPKQDLLYLTPALQKFLRGPAKYVLPLAAVAAFCFFMIGELREKSPAPIMTASAPEQPRAEAQSAREESVLEKSIVSEPATMAEAPAQKIVSIPKTVQPRANEKIRDTLLAAVDLTKGEGKGVGLRLRTTSDQALGAAAPVNVQLKDDAPKSFVASGAQPQATEAVAPESKPAQPIVVSAARREDKTEAKLEEADVLLQREAELQAADDQLAKAAEWREKKMSTAGRMGVSSAAMRSAENINESRYHQALQRAQQTADLKKREKIWRDFLKSNPDSSLRAMATVDLARTLAAASDSTTRPDQLEKNLAFFRDNSATLRLQMGAPEFEREFARLQMLLNFRKSK